MNWLDYTILTFLGIFVYRGFRKGFITRAFGLAGVILGIWLGVKHNLKVAQILNSIGINAEIAPYLAMFLIFLASIITATLIARFLKNVSIFVELTDNILGAILGLVEGLLILGIFLIFFASLNFPSEETRNQSKFYKPVTKATIGLYDFIEKNLGSKIKFKEQIQKTIESIKSEQRDTK
ncbi:MAG: CvpA family protein [Candidatus Kryptonium sp.]